MLPGKGIKLCETKLILKGQGLILFCPKWLHNCFSVYSANLMTVKNVVYQFQSRLIPPSWSPKNWTSHSGRDNKTRTQFSLEHPINFDCFWRHKFQAKGKKVNSFKASVACQNHSIKWKKAWVWLFPLGWLIYSWDLMLEAPIIIMAWLVQEICTLHWVAGRKSLKKKLAWMLSWLNKCLVGEKLKPKLSCIYFRRLNLNDMWPIHSRVLNDNDFRSWLSTDP